MKDPCVSCPKKLKAICDRHSNVCNDWIDWIFCTYKDRNATQMRITQYTEVEE